MVRGAVVDSQCDSELLLNASPALLQVLFNLLDFIFKRGSGLHQRSRLLWILCASQVNLLPQFFRSFQQFLDGLLCLLDLIDRPFHVLVEMISCRQNQSKFEAEFFCDSLW